MGLKFNPLVFGGFDMSGSGGGTGPEGPRGEFNYRQAWKAATAYAKGDAVTIGGTTYACIKAMTAGEDVEPPNVTFWSVIAEKGAKGEQGIQGIQGIQGVEGKEGPAGTAAPKPLVEHAFAVNGKLAVEAYPGYTAAITAPEEKQVEIIDLRLEEGTEAEVTIRRNGAALNASYEKQIIKKGTPVRITKTVALADKDYLDLSVVSLLANAPGKLSVTIHERQIK